MPISMKIILSNLLKNKNMEKTTLYKRKIWVSEDISLLLSARKKGMTLKDIGKIFHVTSNAISKALQRYNPHNLSDEIETTGENEEDIIQVDAALDWARSAGIKIYRSNTGKIILNNEFITDTYAIFIINQYRKSINKSPLYITHW